MKSLLPVFACGLLMLAGCGTSNDAVTDEEPAENTTSTVAESVADSAATIEPLVLSPADQLETLTKEYDDKYNAFMTTYRAAETSKEKQAAFETMPKGEEYSEQFLELAKAHPESEAAVDALVWAAQHDRGDIGEDATQILLQSHSDNEKLLPIIMSMVYVQTDDADEKLRGLLSSPNEKTQGVASYSLGSRLMRNAQGDDEDAKAMREEGLALLRTVVEKHSDLSFKIGERDFEIGPQAQGALFEAENLQVGMDAPEIEGADLDGVDFKLSDYKGKVVLLDFWGNW